MSGGGGGDYDRAGCQRVKVFVIRSIMGLIRGLASVAGDSHDLLGGGESFDHISRSGVDETAVAFVSDGLSDLRLAGFIYDHFRDVTVDGEELKDGQSPFVSGLTAGFAAFAVEELCVGIGQV